MILSNSYSMNSSNGRHLMTRGFISDLQNHVGFNFQLVSYIYTNLHVLYTLITVLCPHTHILPVKSPIINCDINRLAELNSRSCTAVVRAAVDHFMRTDPFRDYCRHM